MRKKKSLAYQLECEILIVQKLIDNAIRLGLISSFTRLTTIGKDFLLKTKAIISKILTIIPYIYRYLGVLIKGPFSRLKTLIECLGQIP